MNRIVASLVLSLFIGCAAVVMGADAPSAPAAGSENTIPKEETQGYFVSQLRKDLKIDSFFDGTLTLADVAEKLAVLGCVPAGGWKLDNRLQEEDIRFIYKRMVGESESNEGMSGAELLKKISEALKKAFEALKEMNERQPVSPTRPPNWLR
jgi:hypothetical protein